MLEQTDITRGLVGKYVDTFAFPLSADCSAIACRAVDGRLEIRWQGLTLPYTTFDKDQRVIHAAITENKHLGAVLEFIKDEQDKAAPKKRRAGKQHTRYTPTGRRNDGWISKLARRKKRPAQPARAPILDVYALSGCATVSPQVRHFYFADGGTFQLGCNTRRGIVRATSKCDFC